MKDAHEAGVQIFHVIPSAWGPMVDIRASYLSLSRRRPWVHVITPEVFHRVKDGDTGPWRDPRAVFVCWDLVDPGPKHLRACKVMHVYAEALDHDGTLLLPAHLAHWHRFKDLAAHYDACLVHAPDARDVVIHAGILTYVMPVGWDEAAMGVPRWDTPKFRTYAYHGSMTGRRDVIIPYLKHELGALFHDVTGSFGRGLLGHLDVARASLYVAHSSVASFSTWRLWQTASTSAAMVAEVGDTWPFVSGRHYISAGRFRLEDAAHWVQALRDLSEQHDKLTEVAQAAHEEIARKFTVDHVEDHYLVPAIEAMMAAS